MKRSFIVLMLSILAVSCGVNYSGLRQGEAVELVVKSVSLEVYSNSDECGPCKSVKGFLTGQVFPSLNGTNVQIKQYYVPLSDDYVSKPDFSAKHPNETIFPAEELPKLKGFKGMPHIQIKIEYENEGSASPLVETRLFWDGEKPLNYKGNEYVGLDRFKEVDENGNLVHGNDADFVFRKDANNNDLVMQAGADKDGNVKSYKFPEVRTTPMMKDLFSLHTAIANKTPFLARLDAAPSANQSLADKRKAASDTAIGQK
jgi:hypothetical protein